MKRGTTAITVVCRISATSLRLATIALLLGACGTRYVDLTLPPDAGGKPASQIDAQGAVKCETVKRGDGTTCDICYDATGKLIDGACLPVTPMMPTVPASDAAPILGCKVTPIGDSRCVQCLPPNDATACLKCDAPVRTGAMGESCRACMWSDQMTRCLQCFAVDGTVTHDDCDTFRNEDFPKNIVPPPK